MGLIDKKWALVQVMACWRPDNKQLSGQVLTKLTDAYMSLKVEMS